MPALQQLESRLFLSIAPTLAPNVPPLNISDTIPSDAQLPDLTPFTSKARGYIYGWNIDKSSQPGHTLLRLTSAIANTGAGPLELIGGPANPNGGQNVYQRIFSPDGKYVDRLAGTFTFHPEHDHTHFDDFATYRVRRYIRGGKVGQIIRSGISAKSRYNSSSLQLSGVWPAYQDMRTIEVDRGRLINDEDCHEARRVVVVGYDASKQLFAERNPSGATITLNGLPYTVIGRVRKKDQDSNYTGQDDQRLFIPYETARKDFPLTGPYDTPNHLSTIIASPWPWAARQIEAYIDETRDTSFMGFESRGPLEQEIRNILSRRHAFDPRDTEALSFWNTALQAVMFQKMIGAMDQFFLAVSLVTLLLGGIGVMNIMLVAVRERTPEIGLRKALGATRRSVLWQFFTEGLLLTGLSGIIGFVLGVGLCPLVNLAPMPERFAAMIITWRTGLFAVVVLMLVGVAASMYPACRAATLEPVEALRFEG
jgi:putative ABC transport system permease protein